MNIVSYQTVSNLSGICWPCSRMTALHVLPQRRAASVHSVTPSECCAMFTEMPTNKTSKESWNSVCSSKRKLVETKQDPIRCHVVGKVYI